MKNAMAVLEDTGTCSDCALALEAYPRFLAAADDAERIREACVFADALGPKGEFVRYVEGPGHDANVRKLVKIFRENVQLLVHKTWVEAHDEKRKARVLEQVDGCVDEFIAGQTQVAMRHFKSVSVDIAHLLFGKQSEADDFVKYCFRIDTKLGLYIWFIDRLAEQPKQADQIARLQLLIGMHFLATF